MIGQCGPVILARLRPEYAPPTRPPEVHAYPVPTDTTTVLTAPCGHALEPRHGERVGAFQGVPCLPCLRFTLGSEDRGTAEATEVASDVVAEPPGPVVDSGHYAVGLRGDRLRHLIADAAIRSTLDGRDVVHTMCGHLGWGPLESAPEHWPICPECAHVAGVVA